jgi:TRAP-type C4-dicarboxylate transport system substrate-binding protein
MMKRVLVASAVVWFIGGLIFFHETAIGSEKFELKFQSTYPPPHETVKRAFEPWFKATKEQSQGRINIQFFPPRAIVKENETFEGTEAGLVDIGTSMPGRNPGKFPLIELTELPFIFPSSKVGSQVTWRLFERFPEWQNEFKGVRVLWLWVSATAHVATTKKPVRSLDDLKGMKIIGYTPMMMETVRALGANPIQISPIDAYLALQRGMADGIIMSHAGNRSLKLFEATRFITEINALVIPFYSVMNEKKFNNLPPDLRKIVEETTSINMAYACGRSLDEGDEDAGEAIKKEGVIIHVLADSERERWAKAVSPLHEEWIRKMESKGYKNVKEMFNVTRELIKEFE